MGAKTTGQRVQGQVNEISYTGGGGSFWGAKAQVRGNKVRSMKSATLMGAGGSCFGAKAQVRGYKVRSMKSATLVGAGVFWGARAQVRGWYKAIRSMKPA